jgi:hypothetical protein
MPISFNGDGGYSTTGATTLEATAPASISIGDLLIMAAAVFTTGSAGTITTPTGWTLPSGGGPAGAGDDGGGSLQIFISSTKWRMPTDVGASSYNIVYNTGGTFFAAVRKHKGYSGTATVSYKLRCHSSYGCKQHDKPCSSPDRNICIGRVVCWMRGYVG